MTDLNADEKTIKTIGDLAAEAGLRRIHVLAWRDLDDDEAGGSEIHADMIERLWARAGIEVHHRTSAAPGLPATDRRHGYAVTRRGGRYRVFPQSVLAEITRRDGARDGLVEIWNGVPFMSPVWCRGPRVVWLHHVHGPMWGMALPSPIARMGVALEERLAPRFYRKTSIVTLSESSRAEMIDDIGFAADRVQVIEPGIDARYRPGGDLTPHPSVVAVGRLVPVKNFPRLITIMADVRRRVPDATLTIVGEGYERPGIENAIADYGLDEAVTLAGRVTDDELVSLYRRSWAIASTSIREGWGMTLTEAAACGTPAVATDIAGHADATRHDVTGLLGATDEDLIEGLVAVLSDRRERDRLSEGARQRATELSWSNAAVRTMAALADDALARRGRIRETVV